MSMLIVIPARLDSTRLPRKPLASLAGRPLLLHVLDRARNLDIAPIIVAVDSLELKTLVENAGGNAILTNPTLPSGTDRVYQAVRTFDPKKEFDIIVNLQGDLAIFPENVLKLFRHIPDFFDITTLVKPMAASDHQDPNCVKAVLHAVDTPPPPLEETLFDERHPLSLACPTLLSMPSSPTAKKRITARISAQKLTQDFDEEGNPTVKNWYEALYFSRAPVPHGAKTLWHHLGIYAFRRKALEKFVALPPAPLEQSEKLEQLRAIAHGLRIGAHCVPDEPWISIDTPQDLQRARTHFTNTTRCSA